MFVCAVPRQSVLKCLSAIGAVAVTVLLLSYPAATATGISRGLSVCSTVIIPTLYPFMLLAGWLTDSPLCRRPGRWMTAVTHRLFGLPGCCGPAILLSLVGGYPAGALAVSRLQKQELISHRQAKRMTVFCVSGGPGFIINTVGNGLLGNTTAGLLLFTAHITVSVLLGLLTRTKTRAEEPPAAFSPTPRPFAATVGDTCASLLSMCGFVVLAAMVLSLWEAAGISPWLASLCGWEPARISAVVAALLEVSCGCMAWADGGVMSPFWLSLCLSWGGLSVQGQLAAALREHRILSPAFWRWRLLHGLLSGALSLLLFHLFPVSWFTGNQFAPVIRPVSVSVTASFMLLLLSFLAMLCFCEKKTGKTKQTMLYCKK